MLKYSLAAPYSMTVGPFIPFAALLIDILIVGFSIQPGNFPLTSHCHLHFLFSEVNYAKECLMYCARRLFQCGFSVRVGTGRGHKLENN